jgi:hypothetical protein
LWSALPAPPILQHLKQAGPDLFQLLFLVGLPCAGPITSLNPKMSGIKALMIGVGGVGEAIARMAAERGWVELLVLAGELHKKA